MSRLVGSFMLGMRFENLDWVHSRDAMWIAAQMTSQIQIKAIDRFASDEDIYLRPSGDRRFDKLMNEASGGQSQEHAAANAQPRMQQMEFQKCVRCQRREECKEQIDNIGCICPIENIARYSRQRVFQRSHGVDDQRGG